MLARISTRDRRPSLMISHLFLIDAAEVRTRNIDNSTFVTAHAAAAWIQPARNEYDDRVRGEASLELQVTSREQPVGLPAQNAPQHGIHRLGIVVKAPMRLTARGAGRPL